MVGDAEDADEMAFDAFYRRLHPRVVASLILAVGDVELARDATAEAFTRALADWSRVQRMASPDGWVFKVALNVVRRQARRRTRERELLARIPVATASLPAEVTADFWAALDRLPPRQRLAVALRYGADLTEIAVAEAMGIRRSTVSATLAAARRSIGPLLATTDAAGDAEGAEVVAPDPVGDAPDARDARRRGAPRAPTLRGTT